MGGQSSSFKSGSRPVKNIRAHRIFAIKYSIAQVFIIMQLNIIKNAGLKGRFTNAIMDDDL